MNRVYLLLAAAICALFTSCTGDDSGTGKVFNFDKEVLEQSVPYDAAFALSLEFTAPREWSASSDSEWLTVQPDHGEAGSYTVELKLLRNSSTEARTARIELVCGEEKLTVSVTQSGAPENPANLAIVPDRYVKNVSRYWESDYYEPSGYIETAEFRFDEQNRVIRIDWEGVFSEGGTPETGWISFDYSTKEGSILIDYKASHHNEVEKWEASLGDGGLVTGLFHDQQAIIFEREGRFFKSASYTFRDHDQEIKQEYINCVYDPDGRLTRYQEGSSSVSFQYEQNYPSPNISIDINWLLAMGVDASPLSLLHLRQCGDLGSYIIEERIHGKSSSVGFNVDGEKEPGRYHLERYYAQQSENATLILQEDSQGYPVKLALRSDVEEWLYEFYYDVDSNGTVTIDESTRKNEKTGKLLGYNDLVYELMYRP